MRLLFILILFLGFGACFIVSNHNLMLSQAADFQIFGGLVYSWAGNLFGNVMQVTGYVTQFAWLPPYEPNVTAIVNRS